VIYTLENQEAFRQYKVYKFASNLMRRLLKYAHSFTLYSRYLRFVFWENYKLMGFRANYQEVNPNN